MPHTFTLTTHWLLPAGIEEVATVLTDAERLPDWWPTVYLSVEVVDPGGEDGLGRTVAFHTRGWLPYTLHWQGRLVADSRPDGWTIEATGDLNGRGTWALEQRGDFVAVDYDWRVRVEKPLLKPLTPLLHRLYAANHRWAMVRGREGLDREIIRRRTGAPLAR